MTVLSGLDGFVIFEIACCVACVLTLPWLLAGGSFGRKEQPPAPDIRPDIVTALSVYLGGNRDTAGLRALAKDHPGQVRDTILQYQTIVAGQRDELCELAIALGYVQNWWWEAQSRDLAERRKAISYISALSYCEPVRRIVVDVVAKAFHDPDEQIRLDAARTLLAGGDPAEITRVFDAAMADGSAMRDAFAAEFSRHAILLCEDAIPAALRSRHPLDVLKMLVSWERALPLTDVRLLAKHRDAAVRLELMRLMPYLPATRENQAAVLCGLADGDPGVREAAAGAIRMGVPKIEAGNLVDLAPVARFHPAAPVLRFASAGPAVPAMPPVKQFANWRMLDAEN
ncbi:MAG: hypothetical protein P4L56_14135 [Candidatus Sulfopaludibacter sp.]|nr:hypothetical protein [Candidatus Sulfopaludibacter sp.]